MRGLIGLVGLRDDDERVILPHEDVMPAAGRRPNVLMRTTETNLEPILLVHAGTPALTELCGRVADREPLASFVALDGSTHELWAITADDELTPSPRR